MKRLTAAWIACCFSLAAACTVWAAEERTPIGTYSLDIQSSIAPGDSDTNVTVTGSENGYSIGEIEATNEPSDMWKNGDTPKIRIYLYANDGYYFNETSKKDCSLTGPDVKSYSVSSRDQKETMVVTVTLKALSGGDISVSDLSWGMGGVGYWDSNDLAKHYQVRLRRGNTSVCNARSVSDTSYNFARYFTKSGTYTFYVRAVDYNGKYGAWEASDELYVTSREAYDIYITAPNEPVGGNSTVGSSSGPAASANGAWCKDNIGSWFRHTDGSYTINNWEKIDGYWYYFNGSGYMHTGWLLWNGYYYYLDQTSGAMLTNATTPDGYYVNSDGVWTGGR